MPPALYLDSELYLASPQRGRFSCGGREYVGELVLDRELCDRLTALELTPEEYGRELYRAVFPPGSSLREGFREAVVAAGLEHRRLRFRLHLAADLPDGLHALYWELLEDAGRRLALARSPDSAFSRYSTVPRELGRATAGRPRLLCAVAAPADAARFGLAEIDRGEVCRRLEKSFQTLDGAFEVDFLPPPITPGQLRERLVEGGFHLLHLFGHGLVRQRDASFLVLEDEGGRARFVGEEILAEIFLGDRELNLVTLVACHGGALSSSDSFSGLAGRLVERGLPAVIAMRRAVTFDTAHLFTGHFYRNLARTGRVDAAVNEARQQLFLAQPQGPAWSSPVLYMHLADGLLWVPEEDEEEKGGSAAAGPARPRSRSRLSLGSPLSWLPTLVFLLLFGLGRWPAAEAEAELDLRVSRVSFRLAKSHTVVDFFHLSELAATRLGALRPPRSIVPTGELTEATDGEMLGVLLAARGDGAEGITLQTPVLEKGSRVLIEHAEGRDYHLALSDSRREVRVSLQGDLSFKRLDAPAASLHLRHADSLELFPQGGSLDIDLVFSRFAGEEISPGIPVSELTLFEIVEVHQPKGSMVTKSSTILGGEVELRPAGIRHRLGEAEAVDFAAAHGVLARLQLGEDGMRLLFRGRISALRKAPEGGEPVSLMPSLLDLWLGALARTVVLAVSGALALAVLTLATYRALAGPVLISSQQSKGGHYVA